jgi:hypothetical protein
VEFNEMDKKIIWLAAFSNSEHGGRGNDWQPNEQKL